MTSTLTTTGGFAALTLVLTFLAAVQGADPAKTPAAPEEAAKAMAAFATPGPEHARLRPLAGSWTYTCQVWMDPSQPPVEMTGTIERKWVLGGRFLEKRAAGTGFDGQPGFEGFGLIGFDNARKMYTMTWACTMGTNVGSSVGVCEEPGVFTFQSSCYCPVEQREVPMVDHIRIESPDRTVMESFRVDDGKKSRVMKIVAIRKKAD